MGLLSFRPHWGGVGNRCVTDVGQALDDRGGRREITLGERGKVRAMGRGGW